MTVLDGVGRICHGAEGEARVFAGGGLQRLVMGGRIHHGPRELSTGERRKGGTVLVVSHDALARDHADRTLRVARGASGLSAKVTDI